MTVNIDQQLVALANNLLAEGGESVVRREGTYHLLGEDGAVLMTDVDVAELVAFAKGVKGAAYWT